MLKMSLDALVNMDLDTAFRVLTLDDEVDEIYSLIYDESKAAIRRNPDRVGYLINLLLIARHLERVADHATNIAEEVIYMIEGEIIRHGKWGELQDQGPGTHPRSAPRKK
jgi:phosphate transport system protein